MGLNPGPLPTASISFAGALMVDANKNAKLPQAIRVAKSVEDCNLAWFEDPVLKADPRYATYVASSNAIRELPGLSQNTTYYVTVCVGDSAGPLTNQMVALSNSSSGPWTTILSGNTADTRLFKKTVDYPFLVTGGDLYMKMIYQRRR